MIRKYLPQEFESKLIEQWDKDKIYQAIEPSNNRTKAYILSMFPYPSGAGLHVGHVRIYTGTDILARYFRMKGYAVLNPMGWDAFGLPAENAAIKEKKNPMDIVPHNIANFKRQMKDLGFSFDWDREFATIDPEYYKWTQWLFLKLYSLKNKKGERLVYRSNVPINWCPSCKTGLANEEVLPDGTHERCGTKTEEKLLPQWVMRITDYAERLLSDLEGLDWPKGILEMQKNWIGKKEGWTIKFELTDSVAPSSQASLKTPFGTPSGRDTYQLDVFTTRIDTILGVTFLVISPKKGEEWGLGNKEKDTGLKAINPATGETIPVWIAEYVVDEVGTGIVMGVPAYDERDMDFAKKYNLPIKKEPLTDKEIPGAKKTVHYHLRDWVFSRQRYWGEPFPLVYCEKCGDENGVVPVPETDLPVTLPKVDSYQPTETGESPLSQVKEWVNVKCPNCGGEARRETDTMPNWAGSCWYFLAFAQNSKTQNVHPSIEQWDKRAIGQWLPVDWYLGGAEHAVLHLLYARFWTKAFKDLGLVNIAEPFMRLRNVGMVLAEDNRKMSKSWGNVINPDDIVKEFGADTLRVYEAFMAPFSQEVAWSTKAMQGSYRFLTRIWQMYHDSAKVTEDAHEEDDKLAAELQRVISKISEDITNVKFNTSIAAMMEFLNHWDQVDVKLSKENAMSFLKLLAPFAPFATEHIWQSVLNQTDSIHQSTWPEANKAQTKATTITIPVQIDGKVRDVLTISSSNASEQEVLSQALKSEKVKKWIEGKKYKVVYKEGKILSLVRS